MRSRKEIVYLNIKNLTPEEIGSLGDMELNSCDNCGEIDQSEKLHWIDQEDYYDDKAMQNLVASGMVAICNDCHNNKDDRLAQCGSCDKYFIVDLEDRECTHCHSGNWALGCIDEQF